MNVISICRVSSREQREGYSLDAQDRANREWAERNGHAILRTIQYQETSGKRKKREQWNVILGEIRDYRDVDWALFHKIDRASRNMPDWYQIEALQAKHRKVFFYATQNFATDATGRLNTRVMASFSAFYIENLADEVKKGFEEAIRQGHFPHQPPYGYRHHRMDERTSDVVIDETRAKKVQHIFELYATRQYSLTSLRERLFELGIYYTDKTPRFTRSYLEQMLKNRFYLGQIPWRGKLYPGKHPAIVPQELFDRVQAAFAAHNRHKYRRWGIYYSGGLITCGHCESAVTVEMVKGKYAYVRCSSIGRDGHPSTRLPGHQIEDQLVESVRGVEMPTEVCEWLRDLALEHQDAEARWNEQQARKLQEQAERLRRRLDEAYLDKLDGVISAERYEELSRRWEVELGQIDRSVARHDRTSHETVDRALRVFELTQDLANTYVSKNPAGRRRILDALCLNIRLEGVSLVPTYTYPFELLAEGRQNGFNSGREDLNLRPLDPQSSALNQTAPRPDTVQPPCQSRS